MTNLDEPVWAAIEDHARSEYPSECCGLVIERADGSIEASRCKNVQDRLHTHDPKAHPRTSRTAYRMDDVVVARLLGEAEEAGGRLAAIYHSHVDCDAYFSEEDQRAATFCGEPAYPGVTYLVVSIVDGSPGARKAFDWNPDQNAYTEAPLCPTE